VQNNRETVLRSLIAFIICALHNTCQQSFKDFRTIGENSVLDNQDSFCLIFYLLSNIKRLQEKRSNELKLGIVFPCTPPKVAAMTSNPY
jgi:hypothetical protein